MELTGTFGGAALGPPNPTQKPPPSAHPLGPTQRCPPPVPTARLGAPASGSHQPLEGLPSQQAASPPLWLGGNRPWTPREDVRVGWGSPSLLGGPRGGGRGEEACGATGGGGPIPLVGTTQNESRDTVGRSLYEVGGVSGRGWLCAHAPPLFFANATEIRSSPACH